MQKISLAIHGGAGTILKEDLTSLLVNQKQITTTAEDEDFWGDDKEYHVIKLKKNPEIATMHNSIVKTLKNSGAVFNEDRFVADGFIPHSTVQKHARLNTGDSVTINSVTLIDMFPKGDWRQRKVVWTVRLKES